MEKMRKIMSVHILRGAASQRHYNKFCAGLTLIPLWTNHTACGQCPRGIQTALVGFGQL